MSTELVTLDRFVGDCYIIGAKLMMRALQGKSWGGSFLLAQFALAMHMVQPAGFLLLRRGRRVVWVALEALQDETI